MPTLLISVPLGVRYLATVIARPEPSESPTVVCTRPLPNVASSPTTTALLLSLSAPDRTSDALAVPLSTRTAMGTLFAQAPPSVVLRSTSTVSRTPSASAMLTTTLCGGRSCFATPNPAGKDPPELARRSNTNLDAEAPQIVQRPAHGADSCGAERRDA